MKRVAILVVVLVCLSATRAWSETYMSDENFETLKGMNETCVDEKKDTNACAGFRNGVMYVEELQRRRRKPSAVTSGGAEALGKCGLECTVLNSVRRRKLGTTLLEGDPLRYSPVFPANKYGN
jgi:1-aminocyclopropane-1-carboxylate deaminase/D-cysteine desulfhydrase-like pyridoxal-dependent ACC family enzyme